VNPRLRNALLAALAAALLAPGAPAQVGETKASARPAPGGEPGPPRARKVDEFGRLYGCDGGAHLDNFAHYLTEEPDSTGYIVAYDERGRAPLTAHLWGKLLLQYLVEYRGIDESRLRLVDAGERAGDDLHVELWLAPPGAEPPAASPPRRKRPARPFAGRFKDYFAFDGTQFYDTEGYSPGSYEIGVTYSAFAELLKRQPDSQGYVVVYARRDTRPGYWRGVATRERQKLTGDGLGAERLSVIRGGVNEGERKGFQGAEEDRVEGFDRVELWVGEKGKPPVRHRPERETLEEAALVASIDDYSAGDEKITRWGLDNLFESGRANPRSTLFIVVYPDAEPSPDPEGKPPADLFKLAASMKNELSGRGVEETRLVVMNGPASDYDARIELWAVPYGAAPPDPFAKDGGEKGAEESEPEGPGAGR
jgi:hypothetical protein